MYSLEMAWPYEAKLNLHIPICTIPREDFIQHEKRRKLLAFIELKQPVKALDKNRPGVSRQPKSFFFTVLPDKYSILRPQRVAGFINSLYFVGNITGYCSIV